MFSESERLRFRRLTTLAAVLAYLLVVSGNIVRVTDSGLGCPDWPFCYGSPFPPPTRPPSSRWPTASLPPA
ncbi:MAG: COX15/CtaA family protein [Anaerolineae bacterium]|nr:COX15/CtaA family protein [Anaerolineae bacterium]